VGASDSCCKKYLSKILHFKAAFKKLTSINADVLAEI
jgi:hypothetical protein